MLIAVGLVKDEADIIGWTLGHLVAQGVDRVIVADNGSSDDTRTILKAFPEVEIVDDKEPGYYQDRKMTNLAHRAILAGAEWVLPFDADEQIIWPDGTLADFFARQPDDVGVVAIRGWDYLPRVTDAEEPNPYWRVDHYRPLAQRLNKVAFRAAPYCAIHMGNHDVTGVMGRRVAGLELKHIQYRSAEQMRRKLRNGADAYRAAPDIDRMHGTHWRIADVLTDADIADRWAALLNETGLRRGEPWTSQSSSLVSTSGT